jgi:nucleotide-binding universal stress UspA family protein
MTESNYAARIVVGIDGSEASIEALRQAQRLGESLHAEIEAIACWEYPQMYDGYVIMGIEGFEERARQILEESITQAFGPKKPSNLKARLVEGAARSTLIEASEDADLLVVGRRGRGGFGGLLIGSVSSACVAHAHCPVLVVHSPEEHRKG